MSIIYKDAGRTVILEHDVNGVDFHRVLKTMRHLVEVELVHSITGAACSAIDMHRQQGVLDPWETVDFVERFLNYPGKLPAPRNWRGALNRAVAATKF